MSAKKVSFNITLSEGQIALMMQLEAREVHGTTRAEIARDLILMQLKQFINDGTIKTPSSN